MKQSIMGKALLKGSIMALTNACIIWLFAYIAGFDRSVWMVVIIIAAAALAYVTAFLEARAMQNAVHGGDVSTSSSVVDSSDPSTKKRKRTTTSWTRAPTRRRATSTLEAPVAPTTLAEATPVEAATKL